MDGQIQAGKVTRKRTSGNSPHPCPLDRRACVSAGATEPIVDALALRSFHAEHPILITDLLEMSML